MRSFIAFTKKEFIESARTYKLLIIYLVFILFGMLNPVTAKILPELLSSIMTEGVQIILPEPTTIDAWGQFYKNMSTQLILFVIVFSGILSNELTKGTLINMLTKGLPRQTVILSKFIFLVFVWTSAYWICYGTTYIYSSYLLSGDVHNVFVGAIIVWLYGIFVISMMVFSSVVVKSMYGVLLITGSFVLILMIANMIPSIQKYNPYTLSTGSMELLSGEAAIGDFQLSIIITIICTVIFVYVSRYVFNKVKL